MAIITSDCDESVKYRDDFVGGVQGQLDTDNDSHDHHGSDDCACHGNDHVFPGDNT